MDQRLDKNPKKLAVLALIKEKRNKLFDSFGQSLTRKEKELAWHEILLKAQSVQLASNEKTWIYARDNLFSLWKSRALSKLDNAKRAEIFGGKKRRFDDVDKAIFDILEIDSTIVNRLSPSYSGYSNTSSNSTISYFGKKEDDTSNTSTVNTSEDFQQNFVSRKTLTEQFHQTETDYEKKLKLELLSVEIYHRKLQILKIEKELQLPLSKFTKDIEGKLYMKCKNIEENRKIDETKSIEEACLEVEKILSSAMY